MTVVNGMQKDSVPLREMTKQIPTRLLRLFLRVASLQRGRYVVLLSVGDDSIEWSVSEVGRIER